MNRRFLWIVVLASLSANALPAVPRAAVQNKVQLVRKVKVGDSARLATEGKLAFDMAGNSLEMGLKEVSKITVIAVAPEGNITVRTESESMETTVNGQAMPAPVQSPITIVIKPDNTLVSHSKNGQNGIEGELYDASTPTFPNQAVGAGDSWTREIKADSTTGVAAATAECKLLSFENLNGVDAAKISMSFKETDAGSTLTSKGTFWVDRTTGEALKSEYEVNGLPMMTATASGTMRVNRLGVGG